VDANRKNRLGAPLMFAFREAHEARDAQKRVDLRSDDGERILAGRRAASRGAITEAKLRREVARDLEVLMNTVNLASTMNLDRVERVRRSILNYGFPDVAHRSIDEISVDDLRGEIEEVLTRYEPRLVADSIHVSRDPEVSSADLKIRFVVRADLSCEPIDLPVEFVADIEVDTGKIMINRL
jgi:type VI secretion system protein ImpF